jgi:hypothetical protein
VIRFRLPTAPTIRIRKRAHNTGPGSTCPFTIIEFADNRLPTHRCPLCCRRKQALGLARQTIVRVFLLRFPLLDTSCTNNALLSLSLSSTGFPEHFSDVYTGSTNIAVQQYSVFPLRSRRVRVTYVNDRKNVYSNNQIPLQISVTAVIRIKNYQKLSPSGNIYHSRLSEVSARTICSH